jgi:hypothetical protein
MDINIKEIEDKILTYLYETRSVSPQSLTKIRFAIELGDGREDIRILKASLVSLIEKNLVKKQEIRGNYKIEVKGIEQIEENLN